MEIVPSLSHPGYWRLAILSCSANADDEEGEAFWEYNARPVKLNEGAVWDVVVRNSGICEFNGWHEHGPDYSPVCIWIAERSACVEDFARMLGRKPTPAEAKKIEAEVDRLQTAS